MRANNLITILWPSFIVAGAAEAVFFTVFDPRDLSMFGEPIEASRIAMYSVGFFLFWAFAGASSALTNFFQKTSAEINRCSIPPQERPAGCSNRKDKDARD